MTSLKTSYQRYIEEKLILYGFSKQEARQTSWWLLTKLTGKTVANMLTHEHFSLTHEQQTQLYTWLEQITIHHKPIQYILGTVPFANLTIKVSPPILIPRPETEEWCIDLIQRLKVCTEPLHILDIGTGSGCIALALAHALPYSYVTGVDINKQALALAKKNAQLNNITNADFVYSDLFKDLSPSTKYDIIVSNPPYISKDEWLLLKQHITDWEDKRALIAPNDGFAIFKKIITQAKNFLTSSNTLVSCNPPRIVLEIGYQQGNIVKNLLEQQSFHAVIWHDMQAKDRVVMAYDTYE